MAHPSSTPQTFVGLYDFKETLGEGHFSVVKLAQHVISKQRVAVKIIDKLRLQPDELQHLHHEVRVMKLIRHPSVVRLYQVVDTAKHLYLILELGSGGDLFEHIMTHGAFPEGKARKLFMQIVREAGRPSRAGEHRTHRFALLTLDSRVGLWLVPRLHTCLWLVRILVR